MTSRVRPALESTMCSFMLLGIHVAQLGVAGDDSLWFSGIN